jgi:ABC-2 type transport system permease protein
MTLQPRLVWELARKDLLLFLADRRGAVLCFAVPVLLAIAFGAIFHRPDEADVNPAVHVVAGTDDDFTKRVVEGLCGSDKLKASACDMTTARRRLATETADVIVVLPTDLGRAGKPFALDGAPPRIDLLYSSRSHVESRWVEGVLSEVLLRESARSALAPLQKIRPDLKLERPFTVERTAEPAGGALSVNAYSHAFCGMTLQYLLFWGMDSGLLLLRERRQGIWRRLRAAPVSRLSLLVGKALATLIIALTLIGVTFGVGAAFFGVTINGSVAGFVLMALSSALLSASTGLLVAALGGNENRARTVAILVILTLSLLGGLWLPSFLLPGWARKLALALPTTWAARGMEGVTWQGMPLAGAWPCALGLVGFSAAFLAIAWWGLVRADGPGFLTKRIAQGDNTCAAA